MTFDLNIIKKFYNGLSKKISEIRVFTNKPLTLTDEKGEEL